ncbi:MAG: hypothetical protein ACRD50_03495 [Candidatus Acidiferrales bacterium]
MKRAIALLAAMIAAAATSGISRAQIAGPVPPPPKYEVHRIGTIPTPDAPPVPADEIIRRFTANEDIAKKLYDATDFDQTVRVQELSGDAGRGGEFEISGELYVKPDGQRFERITKPPVSTLKYTAFSLEDVKFLDSLPLFLLTTTDLPHYNLTYEGQQKLDELNTYVFLVKPKEFERTHKYFDGVIWVDDHDFAIVKSSGQWVSDIGGNNTPVPFTMFDIYRENFQDKYWLPTYITSDQFITGPNKGEVHLRLVMRSTNVKLPGETAAPANGAEQTPVAKPPLE